MADKFFLDTTGLEYFWGKIRTLNNTRGGYLELKDGYINLWANQEASLVVNGAPLSQIDVSSLLKDGMLEDVSIVESGADNAINYGDTIYTDGTKFIKFEWNIEVDGSVKVDYLKVDEIGKVYQNGTGINIGSDNSINVVEVDTDITKITESIPVAGGPLATLLNNAGITEISADTDMQTLLFQLFCKELWPTSTTFSDGGITVTTTAPSLTLTTRTVELGSQLTEPTHTYNGTPSISISKYPKVSGFTYGYSATDDNILDTTSTSVQASVKNAAAFVNDNTYKLELSVDNSVVSTDIDTKSEVSTSAHTLSCTKLGNYTLKITATTPQASITFNSIPSYYACSNVKKTHDSEGTVYHKSAAVAEKSYTATGTNSKSVTITSALKYFFGYADIKSTDVVSSYFTDAKVRALTTQSAFLTNGNNRIVLNAGESNGNSLVVAVPHGVSLVDAQYTDGSDMLANFNKNGVVLLDCGNLKQLYHIYVFPVDTGAKVGYKNITISGTPALNSGQSGGE